MARLTLEQLGPLIKKRRGSRGLRQVAAEMTISAATLSRVEAGKQPDLESFTKICAWLGINPGEFLGYKEHEEKETASSKPNQNQTVMLAHFKAGKTMSSKTAQHLGALIFAIHQAAIAEDGE